MKSIFDLKTENSQLSSANQGLTNYRYTEVQSLRNPVGSSFSEGDQVYRWTFGSNKYWIPSKSYFKIRVKLAKSDGSRLVRSDNIAWTMNTAPCLFQAAQYTISDQTVCSVTQNLAQVDTMLGRQKKSNAWLKAVGSSINNWEHSFRKRQDDMFTLGGNEAVSSPNVALTWAQITSSSNIVATDSIIIADQTATAASDTGEFVITFIDAAGSDLDLTLAGMRVGDVLVWETPETVITSASKRKSSGIITSVATTEIKVLPHENAATYDDGGSPAAPVVLSTDDIRLYVIRHDIYEEPNGTLSHDTELVWQPPLSLFHSVKHAIPCAGTKHDIILTPYPDTTWQKNIIQSLVADKVSGTNFSATIEDIRLYILTCDSNKIQDNFDFMLDLDEVQCQSSPITSTQQQKSLDVVGSTYALAIAFQDAASLTNTLYPLTRFKVRDEIELNLTRYYIRYEGQSPSPDAEISLARLGTGSTAATNDGRKDYLREVYHRSKAYDGTLFMECPEDLATFRSRGMYLYHAFPKTASSRNTRVYVQLNFSSLDDASATAQEPFLLLFSYYKRAVVLNVQNGRIVGVRTYDA